MKIEESTGTAVLEMNAKLVLVRTSMILIVSSRKLMIYLTGFHLLLRSGTRRTRITSS